MCGVCGRIAIPDGYVASPIPSEAPRGPDYGPFGTPVALAPVKVIGLPTAAARVWREEAIAEGLRLRVSLANETVLDFVIEAERHAREVTWEPVSEGFVRFDGCMNVGDASDSMAHWCTREQVEAYGRGLLRARDLAAEMIDGWCD